MMEGYIETAACTGKFDYQLCAVLVHTKQGYILQSEETDEQYRHQLHALLNRIVTAFPPLENGNRLILAALDGIAYMCIQEPPDRLEARRTSKLSLYIFSEDNSSNSEASPAIIAECGRMMRRISGKKTSMSEYYYYTNLNQLISAFILAAHIMPRCIEQRMIFNTKAIADVDEEKGVTGTPVGDLAYMELFSIFLSHLCKNGGLSQAKINQAASLSAEISRKSTFRYWDVLDFNGNPKILADTATQIHQYVPSAYPYIAMICIANGYPCETLSIECLPDTFVDDLAETYMDTSLSELSAIRIEHLFLLFPRITLSAATTSHVKQFLEKQHSRTESAIRAVFLDTLLEFQYDLDLIALENQSLCKELLKRIIDSDSIERPALEWLMKKVEAHTTQEASTSSATYVLDKSIAARLFYLRIPCVVAKNRTRVLNDKELIRICGSSEIAIQSIMELMNLEWNPVRTLNDSKLYRKAVKRQTVTTRKMLRAELRASLRNCCHLFRELFLSYFYE